MSCYLIGSLSGKRHESTSVAIDEQEYLGIVIGLQTIVAIMGIVTDSPSTWENLDPAPLSKGITAFQEQV